MKFIFGEKSRLIGRRAITRAEGWALRLQPFDFETVYCRGKDNIADVLSRLCNQESEPFGEGRHYLEAISSCDGKGRAVTLDDIRSESKEDETTLKVMRALETRNWPEDKMMTKYRAFEKELHESGGILMREERAVVPIDLRPRFLIVAHKGHPGTVTMKRLIRERVWWPGMDRDIDDFVKRCLSCTLVSRGDPPEELIQPLFGGL